MQSCNYQAHGELKDAVEKAKERIAQIGTTRSRIQMSCAAKKIRLGIEAQAHAGPDSTGSARSLHGARAIDGFRRKSRYVAIDVVPRYASETRIDHRSDPRNRDRCLGDIRGDHDPPRTVLPNRRVLVLRRYAAVER